MVVKGGYRDECRKWIEARNRKYLVGLVDVDRCQQGGETVHNDADFSLDKVGGQSVRGLPHAMVKKGQGGEELEPKRLVQALAVEAAK